MGKYFSKDTFKKIGIGVVVSFFFFQFLSLVLKNFFPVFAGVVQSYQVIWLWLMLIGILAIVGVLILNIKTLDKKSIFMLLIGLFILIGLIVFFELDIGGLFDMSVIKASLIP